MNWRIAVLASAALGLGVAAPAHAQLTLHWVDAPPSDDALTKCLVDEAVGLAAKDKRDDDPRFPTLHPHSVTFDYAPPVSRAEYRALGANAVILVSVVTHDPKELPLKRVTLRFGMKDVELQPVAARQSTVPPGSSLAKTVGANREDAFFLVPGNLSGKTANLWVFFSLPGRAVDAGRLIVADLPEDLQKIPPTRPDEAKLEAVLAREYPDLVEP
jgi:hypothetical protein